MVSVVANDKAYIHTDPKVSFPDRPVLVNLSEETNELTWRYII